MSEVLFPLVEPGPAAWARDLGLPEPWYETARGVLYQDDCLELLPQVPDESVHTVFADPPFNIGKQYRQGTDDARPEDEYLAWCRRWLDECIRVLAPGGALFVYHLPRWNVSLGAHLLERGLEFRHWVAVEMSASLPIRGRLHPSHYGLLYLTKGKPRVFRRIRTPIQTCRHCGGDIKDYGGHRKALHPDGITLKDVWTDIPPVRHARFKVSGRKANALSTKLLERVVETTTEPGDLVLDPFGGSGTTYAVCEARDRRWIGCEIDYGPEIVERLTSGAIHPHQNDDVVED